MYKATLVDKNQELIIERDELAGYYLIVMDAASQKSIADHLCDSLEEALLEAEELYGVERKFFSETQL